MQHKQRFTGREEPTVFYCEEEKHLKPGARFGPVVRDFFVVECCTSGYGSVIINGKEFPVTPKSCYLLLPGDTVIHTADHKNPRKGVWCCIEGLSVGRYLGMAGISSDSPFAPREKFDELCDWVRKMIAVFRSDRGGERLLLTSYVYGFLATLLSEKALAASSDDWLDRALGLMETHYHDDLDVSYIASYIGLERAYFSTRFKEKTGISPHRYLTELRIRKACALLEQPDCSVSQAARSVGLDAANFSRLFKRETGKTPLQFKNRSLLSLKRK